MHRLKYLSYDFEEVAAKTASKKAFAFYSTAATDCWTRDMNNSIYKRIWFRPRVLRNVSEIDTSSEILGIPVRLPLFICPTGLAKMINPEGEKALARAAKSAGILEIVRLYGNPLGEWKLMSCRSPLFQVFPMKRSSEKRQTTLSSSSGMSTKTG